MRELLAASGRCERDPVAFADLRRQCLAKKVVEGNIDGMAAWAKKPEEVRPPLIYNRRRRLRSR